jgi:hypothetical protein
MQNFLSHVVLMLTICIYVDHDNHIVTIDINVTCVKFPKGILKKKLQVKYSKMLLICM